MEVNGTPTTGLISFLIDNSHLIPDGVDASTITGQIQVGPQGILIRFDQYSTMHEYAPGDVVLIEVCPETGHPKVCVWPDINVEDPHETISLADAHVSNRQDF
jgi:hypothetical protein